MMIRVDCIFLIALWLTKLADGLTCYSCQFSYNDIYDAINQGDGFCTNRTLITMKTEEVIKPCSSVDNSCLTTITTILGSFTTINRACAEHCTSVCESVGYGQDQVSCTDCCDTNNCNQNTTIDYYRKVMGRQFTTWTKPSAKERKYNKESNMKFPY